MGTGNKQVRNDQMDELLKGTFTTRDEYVKDGARLLSAVKATHRARDNTLGSGGQLIEGFMADSVQANGMAATAGVWTILNVGIADWWATFHGGPYGIFGGNAALYINDAAWQEAGTYNLFVWKWVLLGGVASSQTLESKYDTNLNQRSWRLWFDSTGPAFSFTANAGGGAGGDVTVASTHAVQAFVWYFVAGFFAPPSLMRIFVGRYGASQLTIDDLAVGVPASVLDTDAPLTLGSSWANFGTLTQLDPLAGYLGVGSLRFNVPEGPGAGNPTPSAYASRLFHLTRWFYPDPGS